MLYTLPDGRWTQRAARLSHVPTVMGHREENLPAILAMITESGTFR